MKQFVYTVKADIITEAELEIAVEADSEEEAKELIEGGYYSEIFSTNISDDDIEIERINSYQLEEIYE